MKTGRFFRIPEMPTELDDLWNEAQALRPDCLPSWLTPDLAGLYRYLASVSVAGLDAAQRAAFQAEVDELELVGLVLDGDPDDDDLRHLYIPEPLIQPIWSIGIYQGPSPLKLCPAGIAQPVLTAESVTDVVAVCVADPFLLRRGDRWYMFFEVMNWKANKGEIGLATSDDGLHWRYEQIVLAEEFHLSYPHVLVAEDGIYMVPESSQVNSVRLYRAKQFPYDWQCVGELLSGEEYADSSPFWLDGSWWMFSETTGYNDTLRLFYAGALSGPWHEHPKSPIVSGDKRIARPAGRVLVGSKLAIRFAQHCEIDYGLAVMATLITQLTRSTYEEYIFTANPILGPTGQGWNSEGMHHVDAGPARRGRLAGRGRRLDRARRRRPRLTVLQCRRALRRRLFRIFKEQLPSPSGRGRAPCGLSI